MKRKAYLTPMAEVVSVEAEQIICSSDELTIPIAGEAETPPDGWEEGLSRLLGISEPSLPFGGSN